MNKKVKYGTYIVSTLLLSLLAGVVFSCNSRPVPPEETKLTVDTGKVDLSRNILLDIDSITFMEIEFKEVKEKQLIKPEDRKKLAELLVSAAYDTWRNDSGVMVKMMEQDYTIYIGYKGKDSQDMLMIWKKSGNVKLEKWYLLPEKEMEKISELLDKYKSE